VRSWLKLAKTWALMVIITRLVFLLGFVVLVLGVLLGGGGEITIRWAL
jgi:hypothetical protein